MGHELFGEQVRLLDPMRANSPLRSFALRQRADGQRVVGQRIGANDAPVLSEHAVKP